MAKLALDHLPRMLHLGPDARLEQQATRGQQFINNAEDLFGQLVLLQPVAQSQNGGLIG